MEYQHSYSKESEHDVIHLSIMDYSDFENESSAAMNAAAIVRQTTTSQVSSVDIALYGIGIIMSRIAIYNHC